MTTAPLLTDPAALAATALLESPAAAAYLAIAISAVKARDEEVRAALLHLMQCPALDKGGADTEEMRDTYRAAFGFVGRLLFADWKDDG